MTIAANTPNRFSYAGNGATTAFGFTSPFVAQADLVVLLHDNATGTDVTQVLNTNYTISGTTDSVGRYPSGGTVTFGVAPPAGKTVVIYSDPVVSQDLDLVENDPFPAEGTEKALDKGVLLVRRLADLVARSVRQPDSDTANISRLPTASLRASKYLAFDANGDVIVASAQQTGVAIETLTQVIDSIAALKALAVPAVAVTYLVRGYYAVGDGGGGLFRWNSADATADNGGTVIAPNAGSGRWNRIIDQSAGLNVKWFGAKGDGANDDTAAIQATLAILRDVLIPAGTYKITSTLTVPNRHGFVIRGEYQQSILNCTVGGSTRILTFPTGLGVSGYGQVEGLTFSASGAGAGNAIGVDAPGAYAFSMDFRYCTFKASLRKGVIGTYLMCDFYRCDWGTLTAPSGTFKAIEMIGTGAFESTVFFRQCEIAGSNDTSAVDINYAYLVSFDGCVLEPNSTSTAVVLLTDVLGFSMERCWSETNGAVPLVKGADGAHPAETRFEFNRNHLEGNGSGANDVILDVSSGTGLKSVFTNNVISGYTHIILYPGGVYNIRAGAQDCLAHYNNKIFGGTPGFFGGSDFDGGFANYYGTQTNDSAPTGYLGERVSSAITSATNFPTSTQYGDLTSISLPAGDWDVSMFLVATLNGATFSGQVIGGISTTSGNSATGLALGDTLAFALIPTATAGSTLCIPVVRMSLASTTIVYLKYRADYSAGTPQAVGRITARRVR